MQHTANACSWFERPVYFSHSPIAGVNLIGCGLLRFDFEIFGGIAVVLKKKKIKSVYLCHNSPPYIRPEYLPVSLSIWSDLNSDRGYLANPI